MNKIKIIADSTCDLSEDLLKAYDISVIPLIVTMGETSRKDGFDVTPEELYQWSDQNGETPKTAAPSIGDAIEFITPYVNQELDILFFGISEAMSATCNVMRLAAENLNYKRLFVIDSGNLSTGIGLQVLRAGDLVSKGFSIEEILEDNSQIRGKVRASFVVDTLTYLHRGGRCSGVATILANTLKLKPEIVVRDGKMEVAKKYRGNIKAVLNKYGRDKEEQLQYAEPERVFITHSGCSEEVLSEVYDYLKSLHIFREVLVTRAGGVISSHCGPNTLGILYISK